MNYVERSNEKFGEKSFWPGRSLNRGHNNLHRGRVFRSMSRNADQGSGSSGIVSGGCSS